MEIKTIKEVYGGMKEGDVWKKRTKEELIEMYGHEQLFVDYSYFDV